MAVSGRHRVTLPDDRRHRAGAPITDLCRACHAVRDHTVMAVDAEGRAIRVVCDFCGSQHNYRGGGDEPAAARPALASGTAGPAAPRLPSSPPGGAPATPAPSGARPRERTSTVMSDDGSDLEALLRRVVREELGLTPGLPAPKWRGGEVVLRPGKPGLQEKSWPVDALFHKIVMIRNRLRTLEQQLNAAEIPDDLKVRLQSYVTACYGSLTSFNALFVDEADQFKGSGGD
jgi:hypothetical protein